MEASGVRKKRRPSEPFPRRGAAHMHGCRNSQVSESRHGFTEPEPRVARVRCIKTQTQSAPETSSVPVTVRSKYVLVPASTCSNQPSDQTALSDSQTFGSMVNVRPTPSLVVVRSPANCRSYPRTGLISDHGCPLDQACQFGSGM